MFFLAFGVYKLKLNLYGSVGTEPDNLTSMIFEIFIGIAITYTVWLYSKRQHDESTNLFRRRENVATDRIRSYLIGMKNHAVRVKEMIEEFNNLPSIPEGADTPPPEHTGRYIELLFALDNVEYVQKDFIEKLRTITNLSADVLILSDSENILEVCDMLAQHRISERNGKKEYTDINVLCQKIDELLQSIPNSSV